MSRKANDPATPRWVEQIMSRAVATCRPDDRLDVAARIMWEHDCGVVPVTVFEDGGERVVGMLTDRDVCMGAYTQGRALRDIPVSVAMSHGAHACRPKDTIRSALHVMAAEQLHRLPVIDGTSRRLVGLLSFADVAREESRFHRVAPAGDLARTVEALSAPRPHDVMVAA
jgi:CBS domain-containing protein